VIVITFSSKVFGNVGIRAFQGKERGERTIEKTPFPAVRSVDGEGDCQHTHHHSLTSDHHRQDSDVEVVTLYPGRDVELVIETLVIEHVEKLHPL